MVTTTSETGQREPGWVHAGPVTFLWTRDVWDASFSLKSSMSRSVWLPPHCAPQGTPTPLRFLMLCLTTDAGKRGKSAVEQTGKQWGTGGGGLKRARMQQTHAVRHRQYTFEEKSRESFCPDRKQSICGIEREWQTKTNTCKQRTKNVNEKKRRHEIMCEIYNLFSS